MLTLILAVDQNGGLGYRNRLPWRIPAEMDHFRKTTYGHTLIMGRKTFEGIGKPLPGRTAIVLTKDPSLTYPFESVKTETGMSALFQSAKESDCEYFVAGGKSVYESAYPYADRILLSVIDAQYTVDTFFRMNLTEDFDILEIRRMDGFSVYDYRRRCSA